MIMGIHFLKKGWKGIFREILLFDKVRHHHTIDRRGRLELKEAIQEPSAKVSKSVCQIDYNLFG